MNLNDQISIDEVLGISKCQLCGANLIKLSSTNKSIEFDSVVCEAYNKNDGYHLWFYINIDNKRMLHLTLNDEKYKELRLFQTHIDLADYGGDLYKSIPYDGDLDKWINKSARDLKDKIEKLLILLDR